MDPSLAMVSRFSAKVLPEGQSQLFGNDSFGLALRRKGGPSEWELAALHDPHIRGARSESRGLHNGHSTGVRSEEHTSELQSLAYLVCRLLLEKKKHNGNIAHRHLDSRPGRLPQQLTNL